MSLIITECGCNSKCGCPWPQTINCTSVYQTSEEEVLIPNANYVAVDSRLVFLRNDVDVIDTKNVSVKIFLENKLIEYIPVYKDATTRATGIDFIPTVPKLLWYDKHAKKFYIV